MKKLFLNLFFLLPLLCNSQGFQPLLIEDFNSYSLGNLSTSSESSFNFISFPTDNDNKWAISNECSLNGTQSLGLTNSDGSLCEYKDGTITSNPQILAYSKKILIPSNLKNIAVVFDWKCGGNANDYGMVAFSPSGNYSNTSNWINITNVHDGVANGKFYNRTSPQLASSVINYNILGDSIRIGFKWINNTDATTNFPAWTIDNVVICAIGELSSNLGDTIDQGIMARLSIIGYTGTVVAWEHLTGGVWVELAGSTSSYSLPNNLTEGLHKFRVKLNNNNHLVYNEKTILVNNALSVNKMRESYLNIFPNPNKGEFIIKNIKDGYYHIIITNTVGNVIMNDFVTIKDGEKFRLKDVEQGLYFLNIFNNDFEFKSKFLLLK